MNSARKLTIRIAGDPGTQVDPEIERAIASLDSAFGVFRSRMNVNPLNHLEVVFSDDFAGTVSELEATVLDRESLAGFDAHRLGGVVAGKTLSRDEERLRPIVILNSSVVSPQPPIESATLLFVIAHEFAHTLINQIRAEYSVPLPNSDFPSDVAKLIVVYAFDEYFADNIADFVVSKTATASIDDGTPIPLSRQGVFPACDSFKEAACDGLEELLDAIHRYRFGRMTIVQLWEHIQSNTSQTMNALAHAQSEVDFEVEWQDCGSVTSAERFGPLHDCWVGMHDLIRRRQLFCLSRFDELESQTLSSAEKLVLQYWEAMGLTFAPDGERFRINVARPTLAWPMRSR